MKMIKSPVVKKPMSILEKASECAGGLAGIGGVYGEKNLDDVAGIRNYLSSVCRMIILRSKPEMLVRQDDVKHCFIAIIG